MAEISPIFMDLTLDDQVNEMLTFLKSINKSNGVNETNGHVVSSLSTSQASAKEENVAGSGRPKSGGVIGMKGGEKTSGMSNNLKRTNGENIIDILDTFDHSIGELSDGDLEYVLPNIVSILITFDPQQTSTYFEKYTSKMLKLAVENPAYVSTFLRVSWLLFQSLQDTKPSRCSIYEHLLDLSLMSNKFEVIYKGIAHFQTLFANIDERSPEMRSLYRKLYKILMDMGHSEEALKLMIKLLSTYTEATAGEVQKDAFHCVLSSIADPYTFLLEPLLELAPVQKLRSQPIYELLRIFVSENFQAYLDFYKKHSELVTKKFGLDHEKNIKKMKQLTFIQLTECRNEIGFATISKELAISENDVEQFVIDIVKTKFVKARLDQVARKVFISSSMNRTFGRKQWQQLADILHTWTENMNSVNESMYLLIGTDLNG